MTVTAITARQADLAAQFRELPDVAFTRLQYLSPATGCFNRCAFCSQQAGRDIWQLTPSGLTDVATAIAVVAAERGLRIAGGRAHRPGVLFPYLDNDIGSYPYLDLFCVLAKETLDVKLRISTVGYSSRSPHLTAMHERIARCHADVLDGIRLSVTPYTIGWRPDTREPVSRAQFIRDMAAMLVTYRPVLDRLGHGPATAAAELRFAPLTRIGTLMDTVLRGRHVLACGPHLLISESQDCGPLPVTTVERLDSRGQPVLSTPGRRYLHITSDSLASEPNAARNAVSGHLPPGPAAAPGTPTPPDGSSTPCSDTRPHADSARATRSRQLPAMTQPQSLARWKPPQPNWRPESTMPPQFTCARTSCPWPPPTPPRSARPATRRNCFSPATSPSTPARSSTRAAPEGCSEGSRHWTTSR